MFLNSESVVAKTFLRLQAQYAATSISRDERDSLSHFSILQLLASHVLAVLIVDRVVDVFET
jgi:hypothetical protein